MPTIVCLVTLKGYLNKSCSIFFALPPLEEVSKLKNPLHVFLAGFLQQQSLPQFQNLWLNEIF